MPKKSLKEAIGPKMMAIVEETGLSIPEFARFGLLAFHAGKYGYLEAILRSLDKDNSKRRCKRVLQFQPTKKRPYCTLLTVGLREDAELMMVAREPSNWMFEALYKAMTMSPAKKAELKPGALLKIKLSKADDTFDPSFLLFITKAVEVKGFSPAKLCGDKVEIMQLILISEDEFEYLNGKGVNYPSSVFLKNKVVPLVDGVRMTFSVLK